MTTDNSPYSRFMVYNEETGLLETMTEENCNTSQWNGVENTTESTIFSKLMALFKWLSAIFKMLTNMFKAEAPETTTQAVV